jgi:hypothetical protein
LYLDREAWDRLPEDGILVLRIRPRGAAPLALALTKSELESSFGEVRLTRAWNALGCYHFPRLPPAAEAFRIGAAKPADTEAGQFERTRQPVDRSTQGDRTSKLLRSPDVLPPVLTKWEWAQRIAAIAGVPVESGEYLSRVEQWRFAWRPKVGSVRILILAESHVAETPGDCGIQIVPTAQLPCDLPSGYVRLVYCLGYGESSICSSVPRPRSSTPFWILFGEIAKAISGIEVYAGRNSVERISWKVRVLETLQDAGVWLQDASVSGIYVPGGGRRFRGGLYRTLIRDSYRRFVLPALQNEQLEQVWIVGRSVLAPSLRGMPLIDGARVVSLPGWKLAAFRLASARIAQEIAGCISRR